MILDFQKKISPIANIIKEQSQASLGWKGRLKRNLYKENYQLLANQHKNKESFSHIQYVLEEVNRKWRKIFANNKKLIISKNQKDQLTIFPHGYYSFYIPLDSSCKFPDQLTYFFSYFYVLQEKLYTTQKSIAYQQISLIISETQQKCALKPIHQKNLEFQKVWQKCLDKYTCGLDSIQKIQIYLQLLKGGTKKIKQIFQKKKYKCDFAVFQTAIIRCQLYFRQKTFINKNIQSFSMAKDEELNQNALTKTMKMLFCPLCNVYDCARHEDDSSDHLYSYQYVSPNNLITDQQQTNSALKLIYQQLSILKSEVKKCEDPCSIRCFKYLQSRDSYKQLEAKKVLLQFSPLVKGIINLGVNCFGFDPCCIWPLVQIGKKVSFKVTCDIIFLYFIEDYNILKKIQLKLKNCQQTYLMQQKKSQDINPILYKNIKQKKNQSENKQKSRFAVCHHHFINHQPFDLGCNNCQCSKRGFCRIECLCTSDCRLKKGCNCKTSECSANRCICFQTQRQCQPGLCLYCYNYDGNIKTNKCKNCLIIENDLCLVKIGKSKLPGAGLGLFADQNIKAKQLVYTYTGDIIETEIESMRQKLSQSNDFYNFACHNQTIDSRFIGNKARFINHGNEGEDNLASQVKMSKGVHVIVFYAKRDIAKGEELFFNYDGEGQLFKNHKHKYPFIKKR